MKCPNHVSHAAGCVFCEAAAIAKGFVDGSFRIVPTEPASLDIVERLTAAVRSADAVFESVGGSTRHYVRDCLLQELATERLSVVDASAPAAGVNVGLDAYQSEAARTAGTGAGPLRIAISALGVAGEAGEVADLVKKQLGHGHPPDTEKLTKELGDVLWYVADLARLHGIKLSAVAEANIAKLKKRYPNGFSEADSLNRGEK